MARDPVCGEIMLVTGCDYATAMRERDLRWATRRLDGYLSDLRAQLPRGDGEPVRCVVCLESIVGTKHSCTGRR